LLISCGGSYESQDREELVYSFEDNFGFKPPNSLKEIKLKNWVLRDATVHWMGFYAVVGVPIKGIVNLKSPHQQQHH
jgi:hypothetical protein